MLAGWICASVICALAAMVPFATDVRMDCAGRMPLLRSLSESETRFWGVLMSSVGRVLEADYLPEEFRAIDILGVKPGAQGGIRDRNRGAAAGGLVRRIRLSAAMEIF